MLMASLYSSNRLKWVALAIIFAFYISTIQPIREIYSPFDKLTHALGFLSVFFALAWALPCLTAWKIGALAALLGALVEALQLLSPRFDASWGDWFADLLGVSLALFVHSTSQRCLLPPRGSMPSSDHLSISDPHSTLDSCATPSED